VRKFGTTYYFFNRSTKGEPEKLSITFHGTIIVLAPIWIRLAGAL